MGTGKSGARGGGASPKVAAAAQKNETDAFVDEMVQAMTGDDGGVPMSNGDLQGAVEYFAETHTGINEDALLDRIRDEVAIDPYMKRIAKADSIAELNDIVEDAANAEDSHGNSILTNKQYELVYTRALDKIKKS